MDLSASSAMPDTWAWRSINEVCERVTSGGTPSRRIPDFYMDGTWPWVKTQELRDGWLRDTEEHITDAAIANSSAKVLPANAVLVAMYGATVGKLGLLAREMTCNQACCALIVNEDVADYRFIYYALLNARPELISLAVGAAQQNLSASTIKTLRFAFAPLPEQRAIAAVLGAFDDKIELNRKTSATLEGMARALFTSWFVDFDPVRAKSEGRDLGLPSEAAALFPAEFDQNRGLPVPSGWKRQSLDDVASFLNGLALQRFPPRDKYATLPVIKIAQLRAGNVVGADRADAAIPSDYVIENGDILFSWSGSLECEIWVGGPGALNQHLFKVRGTAVPDWFAYLSVKHHLPDFRHIAAGKATTMGHIQRHHLHDATIAVPSKPILEMASSVIGLLIESSWKHKLQAATLGAIRDTLLPKLVCGEIRVPSSLN